MHGNLAAVSNNNTVTTEPFAHRFVVRSVGRIQFIECEQVAWLQAAGCYVTLHHNNHELLLRQTMNELEEKLDPRLFIRIHRSAIVNMQFVKELRTLPRGEYKVILTDNTELKMSRSYRENLERFLGESL